MPWHATHAPAKINGLDASVLYDTGCDFPVLVNSKFVKEGDYTSRIVQVKFGNNAEDSMPVAMVDVDTPYVQGRVAAACSAGLPYDFILGCRYVLPQPNPATCTPVDVAAVETRSQKRQAKTEPMATADISVQNMLPTELRRLQKEDA